MAGAFFSHLLFPLFLVERDPVRLVPVLVHVAGLDPPPALGARNVGVVVPGKRTKGKHYPSSHATES